MNPLRIAVVGVGALGRHHARILSEIQDVELVAVVDLDQSIGQKVADQCGVSFTQNYRDLFDRIDAVSIAVPTTGHLPVASEFLSRQIPVLVEKPLASNLDESRQLVHLADTHDVILQVGHVERFNPARQVMSRYCGSPKYIRAERISPYSFRSTDIGVIHDLMIHDIDLILDLVNSPVQSVEAFGICIMGGHEDSVQARLSFKSGCVADLSANRVSPTASRTMQIWSHLGCVTTDFTSREVVCYSPSETTLFGTPPVERAKHPKANVEQLKQEVFGKFLKVHRPKVPADDALTAELSSFVDCVKNKSQPVVGGPQALEAMMVAEQISERVMTHQWDGHAEGAIGPYATGFLRRKLAG